MMPELIIAAVSAFWLGVLTSISPCPLATNIAAISFLGRTVKNPSKVIITGLVYTLGRTLTYIALGVLLVSSILSAPSLSHALQKYMNLILGPILILVGMVLLELITINITGRGMTEKLRKRAESLGIWGAGFLGILFALSFCPVSVVLFFGSLIPLAIKLESSVLIPAVYGVATGLPVLLFAILITIAANKVGQTFNRIVAFEKWAQRITGVIFILVGAYYSFTQIFGVSF